ncbi:MAG: hypothetical protein RQ753_04125 [Desulfurivibrionaceae bacterium]|nr:hypothetical protein [Desulfobulbales bacterium]MDT8334863.1 hypothetical protein [Desulfurivibrionaceae bacterium]
METQPITTLADLINEIYLLIDYSAPEEESEALKEVLEGYAGDAIAMNVFHHFYSYLPDAREDGITGISRVARRHGVFLFCVTTLYSTYLYLATRESTTLLGPFSAGIEEQDLLEFFGWRDDDHFREAVGDPAELDEHIPMNDSRDLCPVCGTGDGEFHAFGCPVEICPWCDGQLTNCECRFIKTGREQLSRDSHLDELLARLEDAGRVPYSAAEHRPSFLTEDR